jgi:hypothetical protein
VASVYPMMPGIPSAGHVAGGAWHPGGADGCAKCAPPPPRPVNRNVVHGGDTITYTSVVGGDPELTGRVEYATRDACHVVTPGGGHYAIAWRRVTGHTPNRGGGRG